MQNSRHVPGAGTLVEVRGRRWRLVDTRPFERCTLVTLQGVDRGDAGQTLRVLTPFDRVLTEPRAPRARIAGRLAVARRVTDAVLSSHPWSACWTAATAHFTLLPWQLEPALAVLGGATRVLLADAVGLGKTVQAGLVLAELVAHGLVDRALVLTPPGLRAQWADELALRFALRATILDQAALAREAANLPADVSPWAASSIVISSIDLVKRPEVMAAVDRVPIDLLIVDEAHHVTPGSDRGALVERLANRTPWVVLISATPHSGDEQAFAYLANIGGDSTPKAGPHEILQPTLRIFRRARPAHERRTRSTLVAVRTSDVETALLTGVQDYATAMWKEAGATTPAVRLVAMTLARRAASSADAVLRTLRRRRMLLDTGTAPSTHEQPSLPWEEVDDGDDDVLDRLLIVPGLARVDEERRHLDRLIDLAQAAQHAATKARWIERWLARTREPVIVFSEYRDTIEALSIRFEPLTRLVTLHGGLSPAARRETTTAFVGGNAMLLLATDTGGEGLNLHARCRVVINNELPWNPMRLQQRVGRVDRIGQRRPVHAVHLMHRGSIEQTVLARLHRRLVRAAAAMPALDRDFDALVGDTVLGGAPMPTVKLSAWRQTPMPDAEEEARRLERLRALARLAPPFTCVARCHAVSGPAFGPNRTPADQQQAPLAPLAPQLGRALGLRPVGSTARPGSARAVPLAVPRRFVRGMNRLLCVFQIAVAGADGRTSATAIVPIAIALRSFRASTRRELLTSCDRLIHSAAVHEALARCAADTLATADAFGRMVAQALADRLGVLRTAWAVNASQLYQPALFDGRAAGRAAERSAVREIHDRHLDDLERVLRGLERPAAQAPVLVGAWLEP